MKTLLLLFLLSANWLYADWKVIQRRDSPTLTGKATASELRVTNGAGEAAVQLVYFTPGDVRFEVVANLDGKIPNARDAVDRQGGLAAVNGGYFEANLDPLGLLVSNHQLMHPLQKAKLLSGIFYVKNGQPELKRMPEFPGAQGVQEAIQSGPFLVDNGRVVAGLNNSRSAARTFIFYCGPALWGFGICRSVTLAEMGDILAHAKLIPGHRFIRGLNFDGGSSTTLYVKLDGQELFSEGRSVVSNYLVIVAKY